MDKGRGAPHVEPTREECAVAERQEPAAEAARGARSIADLSDEELHRLGLVELTRLLGERVGKLARAEIELARSEAKRDVHQGMVAGGLFGGSGVVLIAALVCGIDAALFALGRVWNPVWCALLGLAIFGILGVGLALVAAAEAKEARPRRSLREARQTLALLRRPLGQP